MTFASTRARLPRLHRCLGAAALATLMACGGSAPTSDAPAPAPRACTLMFVHDGLDIDVTGGTGDGPYRVSVSAGGETVTASAHSSGDTTHCGDGASNQDMGCTGRGTGFEVSLSPPMAADQPARIRVTSIGRPGGPAELTVEVSHGASSARQTLRPTYAVAEPNGPGCGEVHQAHETIALTTP